MALCLCLASLEFPHMQRPNRKMLAIYLYKFLIYNKGSARSLIWVNSVLTRKVIRSIAQHALKKTPKLRASPWRSPRSSSSSHFSLSLSHCPIITLTSSLSASILYQSASQILLSAWSQLLLSPLLSGKFSRENFISSISHFISVALEERICSFLYWNTEIRFLFHACSISALLCFGFFFFCLVTRKWRKDWDLGGEVWLFAFRIIGNQLK